MIYHDPPESQTRVWMKVPTGTIFLCHYRLLLEKYKLFMNLHSYGWGYLKKNLGNDNGLTSSSWLKKTSGLGSDRGLG